MTEKTKRGPGFIRTVLHFVRPMRGRFALGLLVSTLTEMSFFVGIPFVVKLLIDAAIQKDLSGLWRGISIILAIAGAGSVSYLFFLYLFCLCTYRITAIVRKRGFTHALGLPAAYFEKNHSGDTVSRLTNDVGTLRNAYDWPLWGFLATFFAGTGAMIAMLILDWRVSLLLIASSSVFTLLNMRFSESIKGVSGEIQKSLGSLTESTGNILGGFSVIRQFRLQGLMRDRLEAHNAAIRDRSIKRSLKQAWLESYGSLTEWINFGGVLALGAYLAGKGVIGFGTMVALVNYLWNVNRMIRETGRSIAHFHGYMAGAERVLELEREAEEPALDPDGRYAAAPEGGPVVEMRDVDFSYDGKRKALDGFSLEARDGQTVALVGPSGGGKTTALKILLGFHRPSGGRVSIRLPSGAEAGFAAIRGETAYVPQDPFLFDGTIAENIGYGKLDATREEIERAGRSARAEEFVVRLEKGYDTLVGERGVKLSGGQKQRIAIARAFLKDAPVLLLDEATSSLDSHSERGIQEALKELGGRKTVIVIAHRLSTVENADVIYVVDDGKAVERGRHDELLAKGGLYKKLHEMQFALSGGEGDAEEAEA